MIQRSYSQIERALVVLDKSGISDLSGGNTYVQFIFKKAERITAALYILTSYFPDSEPLKWELRKAAAEFIKDTLSLRDRATVFAKEFFHEPLATLARMTFLLSLAHLADLVSSMNFAVFRKELERISSVMEERSRLGSQFAVPPLFEEAFFGVGRAEPESASAPSGRELPSRQDKEKKSAAALASRGTVKKESQRVPQSVKDTPKGHDVLDESASQEKLSQGQPQQREKRSRRPKGHIIQMVSDKIKAERRQIILEVLRKKSVAMISDFSSLIEGCSEKTIQRQLQDLVQRGVLKKEGVRRWSRYVLNLES